MIELERQRLSVNPNDLRSMDRLADALAKTGQPDEALEVPVRGGCGWWIPKPGR